MRHIELTGDSASWQEEVDGTHGKRGSSAPSGTHGIHGVPVPAASGRSGTLSVPATGSVASGSSASSASEAPVTPDRPLGVMDMLQVGIGPSSSHTVGPMRAGRHFAGLLAKHLRATGADVDGLSIELFGSLGATGRGHNTDRAVMLGIAGYAPETVDIPVVDGFEAAVDRDGALNVAGYGPVPFSRARDIRFLPREIKPYHVNALTITAMRGGEPEFAHTYYSVGGGFVMEETFTPDHPRPVAIETAVLDASDSDASGVDAPRPDASAAPAAGAGTEALPAASETSGATTGGPEAAAAPYPYQNAAQLLEICDRTGMSIAQVALANEESVHSRAAVLSHIHTVYRVMEGAIEAGTHTEGVLPGVLHVQRRAPGLAAQLAHGGSVLDDVAATTPGEEAGSDTGDAVSGLAGSRAAGRGANPGTAPGAGLPGGLRDLAYVNLYALAVNEENAAGHRIVTAPTNGAAGIIPAVSTYYMRHIPGATSRGLECFMLAAAAIGGIIKRNASIAGAEVGCQGEVGSASAMAAAGLAEALGGSPHQVENAAEMAMEHSLGLTCDPVAGLVQIPCIERNAMVSVKAINAAYMALWGNGSHTVSFDTVVETMRQVGVDMLSKYKETSEGGLAVNVVEC